MRRRFAGVPVLLSVPQLISTAAVAVGIVLFVATLYYLDLEQTVASVRRLGSAFPAILVPGIVWHLLRTWGWSVAFPDALRPPFTRLFRVRLTADAVSYFTIRGVTGDPLKVLLLYDRVPPEVTTAAVALERLAFAVIGTGVAGAAAAIAVRRLAMPRAWDTVFVLLAVAALLMVFVLASIVRHRTGDYLGRLVEGLDRMTGRRLEASRVVRFVLQVEDVLLDLLRGDRRRLIILTLLPIVCFLVMTAEVWLILWAAGVDLGLAQALAIETFVRFASVGSGAIPANLGALEASHAAVVSALGLAGGGALALTRRVRSLLWAGLGLLLYPRPQATAAAATQESPEV